MGVLGGTFAGVFRLSAFVSCFSPPFGVRGLFFALGVALLIAVRVLVFVFFCLGKAKDSSDNDEPPHGEQQDGEQQQQVVDVDDIAPALWVGLCWGAFCVFVAACFLFLLPLCGVKLARPSGFVAVLAFRVALCSSSVFLLFLFFRLCQLRTRRCSMPPTPATSPP